MWYHFDSQGNCVCSSSGEINPMEGVTAVVWCDTKYEDIYNLRLIDGNIVHNTEDENE